MWVLATSTRGGVFRPCSLLQAQGRGPRVAGGEGARHTCAMRESSQASHPNHSSPRQCFREGQAAPLSYGQASPAGFLRKSPAVLPRTRSADFSPCRRAVLPRGFPDTRFSPCDCSCPRWHRSWHLSSRQDHRSHAVRREHLDLLGNTSQTCHGAVVERLGTSVRITTRRNHNDFAVRFSSKDVDFFKD